MDERLVWYASYGSNLDRDRLLCYLQGGRPPAAARANTGARDPAPPRDDRAVTIPHALFFADVSHVWTGGVAFVDHEADETAATLARAFLMTVGQLADVIAQESARPVGSVELDPHLDQLDREGRAVIGPGRYDTVLRCGVIDGRACLTFTGRSPLAGTEHTTPAAEYLAMVASGLRAAHGLDDHTIVDYLRTRPGVAGRWDDPSLHAAVSGSGEASRRTVTPGSDARVLAAPGRGG
jgi:hypothetical protein